jgi:AcrR family transcriptional regulator
VPSRASKRKEILDATIRLIGRAGVQAVTVRAVEAEAGVAHGNVRHWFGSKSELINATVARLAELDMESVEDTVPATQSNEQNVGAAVGPLVRRQLAEGHERLIARFELFLEAGRRPELASLLAEWGKSFWSLAAPTVEAAGSSEPDRDARTFVAMLDGVMLDQIARPDPGFDPQRAVRIVLAGITALNSRTGDDPVEEARSHPRAG